MQYCILSLFSSTVGLTKIKTKHHVGELDDSHLRNLKVQGPDGGREEEPGDGTCTVLSGTLPTQLENEAISVLVCLRLEDQMLLSYPRVSLKPIRHSPMPKAKGSLTVAT